MDRLAVAFEALLWADQFNPREATRCEPPEFNGSGDVEYFLKQFKEVAEFNKWPAKYSLLHLRACLKQEAQDCGRADTLEGVMVALRNRYGVSPAEARAALRQLRRGYQTRLCEHQSEIQ